MKIINTSWNRKILNYLWLVLVLSFIVPLINMPYVINDEFLMEFFLFERVFKPSFFNCLIMFILEYSFKKIKNILIFY